MLTNTATLTVQLGSKVYQFLCAADASALDVHNALEQMKGYVANIINAAQVPAKQEETVEVVN